MLILKQNAANSVPTPPAGKGTIFLDDSDTLSVKTSDGNVENFPTVAASNSQVLFMNGTSLSGENALTYDFNNNVLNVSGNVTAGNVKTDNLLYANGTPWDLSDPGGSNTQIQFNDDESFGGSSAFTFDKSSNLVTMGGNLTVGNVGGANLISGNYVSGTLTTAAQPNITSVGTLSSLSVTGNISGGNVNAGNLLTANYVSGTLTTAAQPNITSVGTLSALSVSGNATAGNMSATGDISGSTLTGTLTTNAQPNITSVGTLTSLAVTGNITSGNVYANSGTVGAANLTGTLTTNAQPNITSVGTLTSLTVTGNIGAGNVDAGNLMKANYVQGTLTTAAQPNITSVGNLTGLTLEPNADITLSGSASQISGANLVDAAYLTGTLTTAAQPNITSVGTLTSVNSSGNVTAPNVVANTGAFYGNAAGLTNIPSGNISGQVANALVAGTVYTAAQPNITSVGTLSSLGVSGAVTASTLTSNVATGTAPLTVSSTTKVANLNVDLLDGYDTATTATSNTVVVRDTNGSFAANIITANLSGNATTAGTVVTAAQPNITSVGTLTGLSVNGDITAANITANTGVFTGNGSGLSAIAGANVTGQVANALVAGTVYTAAQPNITSVGTLTSLAVTGNVTAGNVGGGNLVSANYIQGTLTTAAQPNITSVGTLSSLTVTGNVSGGNLTTNGTLTVTGPGLSSIAGNLDMTANYIINLAEPVNPSDAATKQYVDDIAQGLHTHDACQAATPDTLANVTGGTITYNNGTAGVGANLVTTGSFNLIDGVNVQTAGTRILVKNEANSAHNGIYVWSNATVITRASDFDTPTEMAGGDFTFVSSGTLYDNTGWVMTDPVTTVGTSPVSWTQFSGAGTYTAGTGLTLTGTVFSVNVAQPTITSVGTLTGLAVNGNITAANITANTGVFTGNGSGLSALAGGNVTGQVANALVAGTVYTAAQPNITSVGTLSSLSVTGNVSAGNVSATLLTGTLATAAQPNVTSLGTLTGLGVNGTITAVNITANSGVFTGNGSGLSAIAGANVTGAVAYATVANSVAGANVSGQVANALVAGTVYTAAQPNITSVGTLSSLGVSGAVTASTLVSNVATGTAPLTVTSTTRVANLNVAYANVADNINVTTQSSGNAYVMFANALTGNVTETANSAFVANTSNGALYATTFIGAFDGSGAALTTLNASNISSGTLAQARLANSSLTVNGTAISLGGSGTVTASTTNALTIGSYLTGGSFNGSGAVTIAVDATTTNTASKVVARDASGNFAAGTITATLSGAATTAGTVTTAAQPNITSVGTLTGLSVSGATSVTGNSALTTTNLTTGANSTAGYITGNWTLTTGSKFNATYADLAEKYVSDADYEPGTVLVFGGEHEVTLADEENSHRAAGVVSTNPAYTMNNGCEGEHVVMLALQGRVPVKVQGPVAKGDLMVTGANGHAAANNMARAGTIIGKSLENFTGDHGVIEIAIGRF